MTRLPTPLLATATAAVLLAAAAPAAAQAPTLTVKPITWDVIGLDSNNVNDGPDVFMVGARVKNTGATTAANLSAEFKFDSTNAYIALAAGAPSTVALGSLAPGASADVYFNVAITRDSAAYTQSRQYHIEFTATGLAAPGVTTPLLRNLYVEKLVSQNRNGIDGFSGPATVYLGDTVTYTIQSHTATQGYEQLEQTVSFPSQIFRIISVASTYTAPAGATNDTIYADAAGWDPLARAVVGPENYAGGKAGGTISTTYVMQVVGTGTSTVSAVLYDFSGSSYHYNNDVGSGINAKVITAQLPNDPTVRIEALDAAAGENPLDAGALRISRVGTLTAALTVDFTAGGVAVRGTDYALKDAGGATIAGTSVTIPALASSVTITVEPVNDALAEGPEGATLSIAASAAYTVGNPSAATVSIADDDAPTVTIAATTPTCVENVATPAVFTVTRSFASASPLTVTFTIAGAATQGTDYALQDAGGGLLTTSVTIPASTTSAVVRVVPADDVLEDGDETVVLTLAAGSYNVGAPAAATAMITDDEEVITVTATTPACAENAGAAVFTLARRKTGNFTVNFTVGGVAVRGTDYALSGSGITTATDTSLDFVGAALTTTITVTPIQDALLESPEPVQLAIAAGSGGDKYSIGSPSDAQVRIDDDDVSTVTITANQPNAAEPGTGGQFTVTRTAPTTGALTVNLAIGGTAAFGTDYTLAGPSGALSGPMVVIPAGQASVTITLSPVDDTSAEGAETSVVSIATGVYNVGASSNATVTIADDDAATLAFQSAASATGDEAAVSRTVTVVLTLPGGTGSLAAAVTVDVVNAGTGSATSGADFTALATQTVTFPVGSTSGATRTVSVTPAQDALVEGAETVVLRAQGPTGGAALGAQQTHALTITDDDTATVAFTAATSASPDESATGRAVSLTLTITSGQATPSLATALTVDVVDATGGSASSGTDYTALVTQTLTFGAGSGSGVTRSATVTPIQDATLEGNEAVNLRAQNVTGPGALGAQATHAFTITDDDAPTVAFQAATSSSPDEAATARAVNVVLTIPGGGSLVAPLTVDVVDAGGGTATSITDHTAIATQTLTFAAGTANGATRSATVTPVQDALVEGGETVNLRLQNAAGGALGAQTTNTFTIGDDDTATVVFSTAASATPDEAATGRAVTLTLTLTSGQPSPSLASAVTVQVVDATGGTATSVTDHVAVGTQTITFGAGATNGVTRSATVTPVQDTLIEGGETVLLRAQSPGGAVALGAQTTHALTITDDDAATLAFTAAASATPDEAAAGRTVSVTLTLPGGGSLAIPVTVQVSRTGGMATSGTDHVAVGTQTLTFAAGSVSGAAQSATVTVITDTLSEGNETVVLGLASPSAPATLGAQLAHTLTITDDDAATVAFQAATGATADESAAARTVNVVLTIAGGGTLAAPVTVEVAAQAGGTATSGTDHVAVPTQTLTFAAGSASGAVRTATVDVLADTLVEGDETTRLVLQSPTLATLGATTTHVLTLTDDDLATVSFQAATSATPDETAAGRQVTVTLTISTPGGTLALPITVDAVDPGTGTATPGADHQAVGTQALGFAAGTAGGATRSVVVNVLQDALVEGAETVALRLQSPTGPVALGGTTTHALTITDDDVPVIDFAVSSFLVHEGQASAQIVLRRSGSTAGTVGVTLTSTDDTAVAGSDYAAVNVVVTFGPGQTTATAIVPLTNDLFDEPLETVSLALSAPTGGAQLGARVSASLGIEDEPAIDILTTSLPGGSTGSPYAAPITLGDGGRGPTYSWSVVTGSLPPGLVLVGSGPRISLAGTPLTAGTYTFTVRAIDLGQSGTVLDDQVYTVVIAAPGATPEIADHVPPVGRVGQSFSHQLAATDGAAPYAWSILGPALPAGLTLDLATGLVSGVPAAVGSFSVAVQVTDATATIDPTPTAPLLAGERLDLNILATPITITTLELPDGARNVAYDQPVVLAGGVGPTFTWTVSAGVPPPGLTLVGTGRTVRLQGTPTAEGTFTFTVRAADDGQAGVADTQRYVVLVPAAGSSPPVITTPSLPSGVQGIPYVAQLTEAGGQGPYTWALAGGALPAGLTLDPATGRITGTPTAAGASSITMRVTDSLGQVSLKTFTLVISPPPTVVTTSLPAGRVGTGYTTTLAGALGAPGYRWSIVGVGVLPAGLTLNAATGTITGTPRTAGTVTFTVELEDTVGAKSQRTLSIEVQALAVVTVVTGSLPAGTTGVPYVATLAATGGAPGYTWTQFVGALPAWATLDAATGTITGTPTAAGTTQHRFRATDTGAVVGTSVLLDLRVVDAIQITTPTLPGGTAGASYSATLVSSGGTGPYRWSPVGALPTGLALSAAGVLSGTAAGPATYTLEVEVTDAFGLVTRRTYTLTVAAAVTPPAPTPTPAPAPSPAQVTIITASLPPGVLGAGYGQPLAATGGTPGYTWALAAGALPPGLSLDPSGQLTGTPAVSGTFTLTFLVRDSLGLTSNATLTITIAPPVVAAAPAPAAPAGKARFQGSGSGGGCALGAAEIAGDAVAPLALLAVALLLLGLRRRVETAR